MAVSYGKSGANNLTFVANGKQYYVASDDGYYEDVLQALRDDATEDEMVELVDRVTQIRSYLDSNLSDRISIVGNELVYDGDEVLHGTMVERLFDFMNDKLPVGPLVNFITRLMENPNSSSVEELYDFLEHKSLPITSDGCFLAYKAVRFDYTDKRTGKFDNSVGKKVSMARRKVNGDRDRGCESGLHAGTLDYVNIFGNFNKNENGEPTEMSDKCVIVKINPKDVVSVPLDCSCQKLRTSDYLVVKDYEGELDYHLATDDGNQWSGRDGNEYYEDDDDDYDDYDDDDDDDDEEDY